MNLIEKRTGQILLGPLIFSFLFQTWPIFLGLLSGGLVGIFNLRWLWWITHKIVLENKKVYGIQIVGKFFSLAAMIFLIFRFLPINPLAFLVGISSFIPAIISMGWPKDFGEKGGQKI